MGGSIVFARWRKYATASAFALHTGSVRSYMFGHRLSAILVSSNQSVIVYRLKNVKMRQCTRFHSGSVCETLLSYGDLQIFKMAAVSHVGF